MQTRERMFFGLSDMTAWKFAGVNILHMLYILSTRQGKIYGRAIQQLLAELFDNTWVIGNDLLYTILNTYEKEGYVASQWDKDEDPNKRYIRYYWITDKGINYLNGLKRSFSLTLKYMNGLFDTSLKLIWQDSKPQEKAHPTMRISSSAFTVLNILNLLYLKKHSPDKKEWLYGREIKEELKKFYKGLWEPSDGVLYPQMSALDLQGYVMSRWVSNDESDLKKKRTVREYRITEKGEEHLKWLLSPQSGLKNKIIGLQRMCQKSLDFLDGKIPLTKLAYEKVSA